MHPAMKAAEWMVRVRRDLHRHPEMSGEEERTQSRIMEELQGLGLEPRPIAGTGVVADLPVGGGDGPSMLLRADIDALALEEEETELNAEYRSLNGGMMHACGHDGHTAMLLGAARLLIGEARDMEAAGMAGTVRFLFQPAEELPPGGAIKAVAEGGLLLGDGAAGQGDGAGEDGRRKVDAAFGIHLMGDRPSGTIFYRPGPVMASVDTFRIDIRGRGGHGAWPHHAVDPVYMAARFVTDIQSAVSRRIDPLRSAVVSVGMMEGGTRDNVIPDSVRLEGTVRSLRDADRTALENILRATLDGIVAQQGWEGMEKGAERPDGATDGDPAAGYELVYESGYPVLVNDDGLTRWAGEVAVALAAGWKDGGAAHGPLAVQPGVEGHCEPFMGAEDFAYLAREVPGAFFFLGCADPSRGIVHFNHSPRFDIDERVLPLGASLHVEVARRWLSRGGG